MNAFRQPFADLLTIDRFLKINAEAFRGGYTPDLNGDDNKYSSSVFKYVAHLTALGIHSNSDDIADIKSCVNNNHLVKSRRFANELSQLCCECLNNLPLPKYVASDDISQALIIDLFLNMMLIYYWLIADNIVRRVGEFRPCQVKSFKLDLDSMESTLCENESIGRLAGCVVENAIAHLSILHAVYRDQMRRMYKDLLEFTNKHLPPWMHHIALLIIADKLWLVSTDDHGNYYDFDQDRSNGVAQLMFTVLTVGVKEENEGEEA